MDPHWARFLNNNGGIWLGVPKPISYAAPVAKGGVREDWIHGDALPGSVLDDMVKDLIEGEGVTTPILGGQLFYPTVLPGDPEFAAALASAYNDCQMPSGSSTSPGCAARSTSPPRCPSRRRARSTGSASTRGSSR